MLSKETQDKINALIIDEIGCDELEVTPNARIEDDLGADSLDAVELIMRVEEEFGIEIPDEDAEKLTTVKAIHEYMDKRLTDAKSV